MKVSLKLAARPESAAEARRAIASALEDSRLQELVDTALLLTSELVTNAIVHAGSGPRVMVHVRPAVIHVEISDDSETHPAMRDAGPDDTSGRGMSILSAYSDRWGSLRRSGGGKTVWFEVARPDAVAS